MYMCSCSCETFCFAACCRLARGHAGALNGSNFEAARAQKQSPVARGRDSINGHFQRRWNYGGNLPTNIIRNIRTILPQVLEFYCQSGAQQGPLGPRNRFLHFLAGGPWAPGNKQILAGGPWAPGFHFFLTGVSWAPGFLHFLAGGPYASGFCHFSAGGPWPLGFRIVLAGGPWAPRFLHSSAMSYHWLLYGENVPSIFRISIGPGR